MLINERIVGAIIFANMHDFSIEDLTKNRTFASVPFGGRYRMIDFPLSNSVNAGIIDIGVITKSNYRSLMEHIGNGSQWDLARKRGGLKLLPPYGNKNFGIYHGKLEALGAALDFLKYNPCKYILLSDCNLVANIDYSKIVEQHIKKAADVSIVYKNDFLTSDISKEVVVLNFDDDNMLKEVVINPQTGGQFNFSLNILVFKRNFLRQLIASSICMGEYKLDRDFLQKKCRKYKIQGIRYDGYVRLISSIKSYYDANMELLKNEARQKVFDSARPIYTKVRDEAPVKYGPNARVINSFIADGCVIDGYVENSVIFRGCQISSNACVKNSILMQATQVDSDCNIEYVISDKNVQIRKGKTLISTSSYPIYIAKNKII